MTASIRIKCAPNANGETNPEDMSFEVMDRRTGASAPIPGVVGFRLEAGVDREGRPRCVMHLAIVNPGIDIEIPGAQIEVQVTNESDARQEVLALRGEGERAVAALGQARQALRTRDEEMAQLGERLQALHDEHEVLVARHAELEAMLAEATKPKDEGTPATEPEPAAAVTEVSPAAKTTAPATKRKQS